MPSVFQNLQFAAQSLTFLTPAQLVHRAKLVDADFAAIGLKYQLACQEIPVRGWRGRLPYPEGLKILRCPPRRTREPADRSPVVS